MIEGVGDAGDGSSVRLVEGDAVVFYLPEIAVDYGGAVGGWCRWSQPHRDADLLHHRLCVSSASAAEAVFG